MDQSTRAIKCRYYIYAHAQNKLKRFKDNVVVFFIFINDFLYDLLKMVIGLNHTHIYHTVHFVQI